MTDGITQDRQPGEHSTWAAWCRLCGWSGSRRPDHGSARADLADHRIDVHETDGLRGLPRAGSK